MAGENVSQWDRLPVTALEKIFSYLNPVDKSHASRVCKSWNEAYSSPSLWITPVFNFNKPHNRMPRFNPRPTVQRHGAFFRKLTIMCKRKPGTSRKFLENQVSTFLAEMTQCGVQLNSLRMILWCAVRQFRRDGPLCEKLTEFLKTQIALKSVDFTNARALKPCGLKVLESLSPDNVEHLHLRNFFLGDKAIFARNSRYAIAMGRFCGLRTLSINYKYLSVTLLSTLAQNLQGRLELLSIHCMFHKGVDHAIPENSWAELSNAIPDMRMNFCLDLTKTYSEEILEKNIISQFMRLEGFQLKARYKWQDPDFHMLNHLSLTFPSTLKNVELILQGEEDSYLKQGMLNLVSRCVNLEKLTLQAKFQVFKFNELFGGLQRLLALKANQNEPLSLKELRVNLRGLAIQERGIALSRRHMFAYHLEMYGLKFKLNIKP